MASGSPFTHVSTVAIARHHLRQPDRGNQRLGPRTAVDRRSGTSGTKPFCLPDLVIPLGKVSLFITVPSKSAGWRPWRAGSVMTKNGTTACPCPGKSKRGRRRSVAIVCSHCDRLVCFKEPREANSKIPDAWEILRLRVSWRPTANIPDLVAWFGPQSSRCGTAVDLRDARCFSHDNINSS